MPVPWACAKLAAYTAPVKVASTALVTVRAPMRFATPVPTGPATAMLPSPATSVRPVCPLTSSSTVEAKVMRSPALPPPVTVVVAMPAVRSTAPENRMSPPIAAEYAVPFRSVFVAATEIEAADTFARSTCAALVTVKAPSRVAPTAPPKLTLPAPAAIVRSSAPILVPFRVDENDTPPVALIARSAFKVAASLTASAPPPSAIDCARPEPLTKATPAAPESSDRSRFPVEAR